jgi:hypothetical protein
MVCDKDWEPRQPQDFVRGVADYQAPPFTRPEPSDSFIQVGITYIQSIIASVTSTASLTYHVLQRLTQQITATATSVASIIAVYLPFSTKVPKTLDGASVNKTTLG